MPIVMPSAGSSTAITGSGRGSSGSAIVSPIVISGMPARAMISPGAGLVGGHALRCPRSRTARVTRTRSTLPSRRHQATVWPFAMRAVVHAAEREPADVRVGVEVRDERLQRMRLVVLGRRDALDEQVEQRPQVRALDALLE